MSENARSPQGNKSVSAVSIQWLDKINKFSPRNLQCTPLTENYMKDWNGPLLRIKEDKIRGSRKTVHVFLSFQQDKETVNKILTGLIPFRNSLKHTGKSENNAPKWFRCDTYQANLYRIFTGEFTISSKSVRLQIHTRSSETGSLVRSTLGAALTAVLILRYHHRKRTAATHLSQQPYALILNLGLR